MSFDLQTCRNDHNKSLAKNSERSLMSLIDHAGFDVRLMLNECVCLAVLTQVVTNTISICGLQDFLVKALGCLAE